MTNYITPPMLLCDMYKLSHKVAYPKGTTKVYSTFTPRSNKYMPMANKVVVFGLQGFIKKYLIDYFNENFFNRELIDVVHEYVEFRTHALFEEEVDATHIIELHNLGYLPLEIKALDEGTLAPLQTPVITVENTHPDFYWLTNFIETLMSNEIWLPMTSATYAHEMRKLLDGYAMKTVGNTDEVAFQGHDFSMRGMSSVEATMTSGAGHLLSFIGTDAIPAIFYAKKYYNADYTKGIVGTSIPATEHSVMTALTPTDGDRDEREAYKTLITETFPKGLVSLVSDSYDFWKVVNETIPSLKNEIMNRDGKVVIRPDSGNPVDILCGVKHFEYDGILEDGEFTSYLEALDILNEAIENGITNDSDVEHIEGYLYSGFFYIKDKTNKVYAFVYEFENHMTNEIELELMAESELRYFESATLEEIDEDEKDFRFYIEEQDEITTTECKGLIECLWDTFGGTVSNKGYKVLDSHIGAIYGDSITYERAEEICFRLMEKGFASTNVVMGMGSYGYQYRSRDSLGFAMKATYAEIDGKPVMLMKEPKTDSGKKSQRGRVAVLKEKSTGELFVVQGLGNSPQDEALIATKSELKTVFYNGKVVREQTFTEIRNRLNN